MYIVHTLYVLVKKIEYNEDKDKLLSKTRGVKFDDFIDYIRKQRYVLISNNCHKNQNIFVIVHNGYPYCIPFVEDKNKIFLKTIFPNRKFKYLLKNRDNVYE